MLFRSLRLALWPLQKRGSLVWRKGAGKLWLGARKWLGPRAGERQLGSFGRLLPHLCHSLGWSWAPFLGKLFLQHGIDNCGLFMATLVGLLLLLQPCSTLHQRQKHIQSNGQRKSCKEILSALDKLQTPAIKHILSPALAKIGMSHPSCSICATRIMLLQDIDKSKYLCRERRGRTQAVNLAK